MRRKEIINYGQKLWNEIETVQADSFIGESIIYMSASAIKMVIDNSIIAHEECIKKLKKFKNEARKKQQAKTKKA